DIYAIKGDAATRDVVKARDQLRNCALPTPSAAQQSNDLARRRAEGNVMKYWDVRTIAKMHMLELYPSFEMWQGTSLRGLLDIWNRIENFKEAFGPGLTERDHPRQPAQSPERLSELSQIARGCNQRPQTHRPSHDLSAPNVQCQGHGERQQ